MSIRSKLIITFSLISIIPIFFVSVFAFNNYQKSLETVRLSQLVDLAKIKSDRLEEYFLRLRAEMEMAEYFFNIKQNLPILDKFSGTPTVSEFSNAKNMLDGQLSKMQEVLGLSGIILLDSKGKVLYTSDAKSYATYFNQPMQGLDQKALEQGAKSVYFSNPFLNQNKNNAFEILVVAPSHDFSGSFVGFIVFEVDMNLVNNLLKENTGLGKTGEILIGKLSGSEIVYLNSLKYESGGILEQKILLGGDVGVPIQKAVKGETGSGQLQDYRDKTVIAAWKPVPLLDWGLVAKIDSEEAFADAFNFKRLMIIILGFVFIFCGFMSYLIAISISKPIKKLSEGVKIIGRGNMDYKVATNKRDEVGQLSRSFDKTIEDLKNVMASQDELDQEIIERKKSEVDLRASEERWATTLSSIGDGVISTDSEGRISFMNVVAENLTGWTLIKAKNLFMKEVFNIVNEQTRLPVDNPAIKALNTGSIIALANHTILIKKDKTEIPIDDSGAPIRDSQGKIIGAVLVFRDITERKFAEKAKNNFIAVLAHELRNPLAPLLFAIQKLEIYSKNTISNGNIKSVLDPVLKESIDISLRQITSMKHLLDDLLDVSRIEQNKINLKIEKLDLVKVLENVIVSVQSRIDDRGHTFSISMPEQPLFMKADSVRLEQIFVNLLNNAAKYTDHGGHIWLKAKRLGNFAEISIKDDGIGIDVDKISKLFEPFYQTESALKHSHGGLGLGLMLVKTLLKMHNGSIEVNSQGEGKGSEFIVLLPVLPISASNTSIPTTEKIPVLKTVENVAKNEKKILIVDDNKSITSLMRDLLEHLGHKVKVAHEGESAIALAYNFKPDFVLCDIGLPGMDGYEVARRIRLAENENGHATLVAVTGFGQDNDKHNAHLSGFNYHLVKPVEIETLIKIINKNT